jgi:uncharacterized small protein (DUF1192 family)
MWYTVVITLVVDIGGLLLVYALLRDRVRRATSAANQIAELREEVSRLVVELNQTTERNVALLEDKILGLSDTCAAADRRIALLKRDIEKHDAGTKVYSRLVEGAPPAPAAPRPSSNLSVELSGRVAERPPSAPKESETIPRQDARERVVMLSRSGFSSALIAARVGMPLGEVELIISLERQRASQPAAQEGEEPA